MSKKVVIIGGVAGGATAMARLRRLDENAEIVLLERGEYISFANCGLPYYIGGNIKERDSLLVQKPETLESKFNVDIRTKSEVIKIIKEEKKVIVKKIDEENTYEESYDYLIMSTGSTPIKPPIPGIDSPNIFSLWNIPDTDRIKSFIDNNKPATAIVVGGGFIGLEMAENLYDLGLKVSVVEMLDQVMAPIDFEMAEMVHEHLVSKGIDLHLKDGVSKFEYDNGKTTISLQSGNQIQGDLVILSIGIRPNGELAKDAGLAQNMRGGVVVDKYLKTSDDFIYAIGDLIEVEDYVNKVQTMVPLAGPANKQGRIVANNILGNQREEYKGTQGTSIAKVFDLTVASTGTNEKTLNKMGKEYKKDYLISLIHVNSHAGYYPGGLPLSLKLIYDLQGKILGSQIVGYDGVDKRIDVIASVIRFGGNVENLMDLELAYAPPYSSAKDPVNMIGFAADNLLKGLSSQILWRELEGLDKEKTIFLDIRENQELSVGSIANSIHIPLGQLRDRIEELDREKLIIPYCSIGLRGYIADRILKSKGFNSMNLAGGLKTYKTLYMKDNPSDGAKSFSDSGISESVEKPPSNEVFTLDACGLSCPGPIMKVSEKINTLEDGDLLEVTVTDPGFLSDIKAWCKNTDNCFISDKKEDKSWVVLIKKGLEGDTVKIQEEVPQKKGKTLIVFSGDLDKAIASFIIANGARSMGDEVNMFFTFWGLNILRKQENVNVKKDFMGSMFGKMMPRGVSKLGISKMNMGGLGGKMIRMVMKNKNISSLDELMKQAIESGIKLTACQMSMDVMGITKEELIDGVEIGGVATMLSDANQSSASFFI